MLWVKIVLIEIYLHRLLTIEGKSPIMKMVSPIVNELVKTDDTPLMIGDIRLMTGDTLFMIGKTSSMINDNPWGFETDETSLKA